MLEIGWKGVDRIHLAQEEMADCKHGTEPSGSITACRAEELSACQEALCSMEIVYSYRLYEYMLKQGR